MNSFIVTGSPAVIHLQADLLSVWWYTRSVQSANFKR